MFPIVVPQALPFKRSRDPMTCESRRIIHKNCCEHVLHYVSRRLIRPPHFLDNTSLLVANPLSTLGLTLSHFAQAGRPRVASCFRFFHCSLWRNSIIHVYFGPLVSYFDVCSWHAYRKIELLLAEIGKQCECTCYDVIKWWLSGMCNFIYFVFFFFFFL